MNHQFRHRKWKVIFGAGNIEIPKIDADMKLAILFPHRDNIGYLCWIFDLANKSRLYKLVHFLFNFRYQLRAKTSLQLLFG